MKIKNLKDVHPMKILVKFWFTQSGHFRQEE